MMRLASSSEKVKAWTSPRLGRTRPLKGSWATYPHARALFHIMRSVATRLRIVFELQCQPETNDCSFWPSKSLSAQLPKSLRSHLRNWLRVELCVLGLCWERTVASHRLANSANVEAVFPR